MSTTIERLKRARSVQRIPTEAGDFHVRALTLRQLDQLDEYADQAEGKTEHERRQEHQLRFSRVLLALSVCEADGSPVFAGPDDPEMREVDTEILRELVQAAAEKNNLAKPADREAEDGEGDAGNP